VFSPYSDVSGSLLTSVFIAVLSVAVCLLISVRRGMRFPGAGCRCGAVYAAVLIPQAFPEP
jgi:hypothetical protein